MPANTITSSPRKPFPWLEVVIIAGLLAVLAIFVVPRLSSAQAPDEDNLRTSLRTLRTAVLQYRADNGVCPGFPEGNATRAPTAALLVEQLTKSGSATGPSASRRIGPYLGRFPVNPLSGSSAVQVLGVNDPLPTEPSGNHGWIYHPGTGAVLANSPGRDARGVAYFDY